jgi:hypothetical protein
LYPAAHNPLLSLIKNQQAEFWQDILAEPVASANFPYLTNEQGLAIAIILDFATYAELW